MEKFSGDKPVYLQVVDLFFTWIVSGTLLPGDQIPPVRKLAADLGVNPNTIQKALQTLEEEGIAMGQVGRGRFVTSDEKKLEAIKDIVVNKAVERFVLKMRKYSIEEEEMVRRIHAYNVKE